MFTEQLYQSSLKTPGEMRTLGRNVWESAIEEGVKNGLFGLGELVGENPICRYFKKNSTVAFTGNEILLREEFCKEEEKEPSPTPQPVPPTPIPSPHSQPTSPKGRNSVSFSFNLPKGKVSGLLGILNYLQSNFAELRLEVTGTDGHITEENYEDKIKEAFHQMGIQVDE